MIHKADDSPGLRREWLSEKMITGGTTVPTNCANCAECTFLYSAFAHTILLTSVARRGKKLCVINNPYFLCYPVLDMEAIEDNPLKLASFVVSLIKFM